MHSEGWNIMSQFLRCGCGSGENIFEFRAALSTLALGLDGACWDRVGDSASLDLTGTLTIEAWVKPSAASGAIVHKWGDLGFDDRSYSIELVNGEVQFGLARDDNQADSSFHNFYSGQVTLNQWHHIACTYDGAQRRTYIDGTLVGSRATTGLVHVGSTDISIGAHLRNNAGPVIGYFNGLIDEVRLWNIARTQSQIQATRNVSISAEMRDNFPGLVSSYAFESTLGDELGANPGQGVGTVSYASTSDLPCTSSDDCAQAAAHYYRFEESTAGHGAGGTNSIIDSECGGTRGTPHLGPSYRSDVPSNVVPWTGQGNDLSVEFMGTDSYIQFATPFIFNQGHSDATLEFYVKAAEQPHAAIVWGRPDVPDTDRFQLTVNPGGVLHLDYREPNGSLHTLLNIDGTFTVPIGTWSHVAVTRQVLGSTHRYRFYRDGVLIYVADDTNPSLPDSTAWRMARRPGSTHNPYRGFLDEVRCTDRCLDPSEFLNAPFIDVNQNGVPDACECIVTSYCSTSPNSVGPGALMSYGGTVSVGLNNLTLLCTGCPPNASGLFFYGPQQTQVVFGNGFRCVAGLITRTGVTVASSGGIAGRTLNYASLPANAAITAGSTKNFQFWYRNPAGGGAGFNLSDGLSILFCP